MFTQKVKAFIRQHALCQPGGVVLVGLSGGADSVALTRVLKELEFPLLALHCNFRLRGEESDRDERFVRDFCQKEEIPLRVRAFDTTEYAKSEGVSIEMAARDLRYAWFEEVRQETKASCIAVAHHLEDNAETVLLNLIRGTGLDGLCGMRPKHGRIIRPLLTVTRQEIELYLKSQELSFVTDSTNLEADCTRNKIRLCVLPEMRKINPSICQSITETARRLTQVRTLTDKVMKAERVRSGVEGDDDLRPFRLSVSHILQSVSPSLFLFQLLRPYRFTESQLRDMERTLELSESKLFISSSGWRLVKERGYIEVDRPRDDSAFHQKIMREKVWCLLDIKGEESPYTSDLVIRKERNYAYLDADKLKFPLCIRNWKEGDRFRPFGMKGSKLVSDYLTDRKFSRFRKQAQRVLTDADGRIVWLVGERIDDRYKIDPKATKNVLILQNQSN